MKIQNKYLKNTGWLLFEKVFRMATTFFVGAWVVRYLGPSDYGKLSIVVAIHSFLLIFSKLGLENILIKNLVSSNNRNEIIGTGFYLRALISLIIFLVILFISSLQGIDETSLFLLILIFGMIFQSLEIIEYYYLSQVLSKTISLIKISTLLIFSLLRVYTIHLGHNVTSFVILLCFEFIIGNLLLFTIYCSKPNRLFFYYFNKTLALKMLKESWPLILSALMVIGYMRIDQVIIYTLLDDYQLGIYSSAVRIIEVFYFIPTILSAAFYPALVSARKSNSYVYNDRLQSLYRLLTFFALILSILFLAFANKAVNLVFGSDFNESVIVVQILSLNFIIITWGIISGRWLILESKTNLTLLRSTLGLVINIIINLLLIPKYGIAGAAWGTVVSQLTSVLIFSLFHRDMFDQAKYMIRSLNFKNLISDLNYYVFKQQPNIDNRI